MSSCGSTNCGCGSGCSCDSSCNCESSFIEQATAGTTNLVVGVAPARMMFEKSMRGAECGCGDDCACDPCTCDEV